MKNTKTFIYLILLLLCSSVSYPQKLSTGIYSGVNFSDIHGEDAGGKWKYKPGPVQGLWLSWSFSKSLGIQTGINFSSVYYEHKTSYNGIIDFTPTYSIIDPGYYPIIDRMDFSFLRVPFHNGVLIAKDWNMNTVYYRKNTK